MCDWEVGLWNISDMAMDEVRPLSGSLSCTIDNTTIADNTTTSPAGAVNRPDLSVYPEYVASKTIDEYSLWIFWTIGILGNTAALFTVTGMKPFSPVFIYISCLAVSDCIYLMTKLIYDQMEVRLQYLGYLGCGLLMFTRHLSARFSHWTVLLMTVDRFIAIWFPFKVSSLSTKKNVSMALFGLAMGQVVLNCHYLFTHQQFDRDGVINCGTKPEFENFRLQTKWAIFALFSAIPLVGVLLMNLLIAVRLVQRARNKPGISGHEGRETPTRQTIRVTALLLTVSTAYLFLVTPSPVFYLYRPYWEYWVSGYETAVYNLVKVLVSTFMTANHAINFFLYFLSGTKFRKSFLGHFACKLSGSGSTPDVSAVM